MNEELLNGKYWQYWNGADETLTRLPLCALKLIVWLRGRMNSWNMVTLNKREFQMFSKETNTSYDKVTLQRNVRLLRSWDLLLKESEGLYQVNPYYIYRGSKEDRIWLIKNKLVKDIGNGKEKKESSSF